MQYFIFNKVSDFERGYGENSEYNQNSLWIKDTKLNSKGFFFSRILDSREKGTIWHRMVMESESFGDASVQFYFYTSDSIGVLPQMIHDTSILLEEKKERLQPYLVKILLNPKDILLHEMEGRYLWFLAELFSTGEHSPLIKNLQIFFPKESWIQYLPGVYQEHLKEDTFLERYLGIFQSLYDDLEWKIRSSAGYLEPEAVSYEFLGWLASWLDIDNTNVWQEQKLRQFLKQGMELFKKRGTRPGLIQIVELYTGEKPFVVEYYQTEQFPLERLYGNNPNVMLLLLKESCIPSETEYHGLASVIEDVKPAHMEVKIIALKPCILLDNYSYVGINSMIGDYRPLALDGLSLLSFTTVSGNGGHEVERK